MGGEIKDDMIRWLDIVTTHENHMRALRGMLTSDKFLKIFDSDDPVHVYEIEELVKKLDLEGLKEWVYKQSCLSLHNLSTRKLRKLGRGLKLQHYYSLTREDLIKVIEATYAKRGRQFTLKDAAAYITC